MRLLSLLLASLLLLVSPGTDAIAQDNPDEQIVRVSLLHDQAQQQIELSASGGPLSLSAQRGSSAFATLEQGETVLVRERVNELAIELPDEHVLYAQDLIVQSNHTWTLRSPDDEFSDRSYEGSLHIYRSDSSTRPLQLVNHVPLEKYVASVVSSEYSFDDEQGARAMAVLARTYALYAQRRFGDEYDHVDHAMSQVYRGIDNITDAARNATAATAGEILTHDGEPIQAVYFSSSGGHTANNEDLWTSDPRPYLRGREDEFDLNSPHSEWTVNVNRPLLLERLSEEFGFQARGFSMGDRSSEGRLKDVTILGPGDQRAEMSGNEFRLFANQQLSGRGIRSTFFDARRDGDTYVFEGRGFGHGVGLNQYGALEMSRQGYTYEDILNYYFTDVALMDGDGAALMIASDFDDAPPAEQTSTEVGEDSLSEPSEPAPDTTSTRSRIGW